MKTARFSWRSLYPKERHTSDDILHSNSNRRHSLLYILLLLFEKSWISSEFLFINKQKNTLFKVPEVPKEIVPEKKISVPVPEKPETPPVQGIQLFLSLHDLALVVIGLYVLYFTVFCNEVWYWKVIWSVNPGYNCNLGVIISEYNQNKTLCFLSWRVSRGNSTWRNWIHNHWYNSDSPWWRYISIYSFMIFWKLLLEIKSLYKVTLPFKLYMKTFQNMFASF